MPLQKHFISSYLATAFETATNQTFCQNHKTGQHHIFCDVWFLWPLVSCSSWLFLLCEYLQIIYNNSPSYSATTFKTATNQTFCQNHRTGQHHIFVMWDFVFNLLWPLVILWCFICDFVTAILWFAIKIVRSPFSLCWSWEEGRSRVLHFAVALLLNTTTVPLSWLSGTVPVLCVTFV